MINDCDFCRKIYTLEEYENEFKYDWDEEDAIIMRKDGPYFYSPCPDSYYSRYVMKLNFCPKCGRQINLEHERYR